MTEFVEVPNPKLNNWPVCPYARHARVNNLMEVKFSEIAAFDFVLQESMEILNHKDVVVICFDHTQINPAVLQEWVQKTNEKIMQDNFVILEDHPDSPEYINGVHMNFGECGLLIMSKLDKLNAASDSIRAKGYYDVWTQKDLDEVVTWRYK